MISASEEFDTIRLRDNEIKELDFLFESACCCDIKNRMTDAGKVNILLQAAISRANIQDFALTSESAYILQNASRVCRGLFEVARHRCWAPTAMALLSCSLSMDKRIWQFEHPLRQMGLPHEAVSKLEINASKFSVEDLRDMTINELGELVRYQRGAQLISKALSWFPIVYIEASVSPILQSILNISVRLSFDFSWYEKLHLSSEPWWIWIEDDQTTEIYFSELMLVQKKNYTDTHTIECTIPLANPLPSQLIVRALSDRWLGAQYALPVSFKHLFLPDSIPIYTELLNLDPLPLKALDNPTLIDLYKDHVTYFNPVQTQLFHTLYHQDGNVLVGAPTGSGKTLLAELALWYAVVLLCYM